MGVTQKTSFSSSIQIGGSYLTTSFSHRSILTPESPLAGHPLVAFTYLAPPSLAHTKAASLPNHVGFFFFGPGVKKEAAFSMLDEIKAAIAKKGP
jgi:hypothetical protein